jgi:hypothetical protein
LAALLFLCDLNRSTLPSRWLNRFKVGDRSSSTSRTRNPLNPTNMGLPHLMPAKAWRNWLPGTLCFQMLKSRKSSHCWLVSRSWRMHQRKNSLGYNSWCSFFRDEFNRCKLEFPNCGHTLAWKILLECPRQTREKGPREKGQITDYPNGKDGSSYLSNRSLRFHSSFGKGTWLITRRNILFPT